MKKNRPQRHPHRNELGSGRACFAVHGQFLASCTRGQRFPAHQESKSENLRPRAKLLPNQSQKGHICTKALKNTSHPTKWSSFLTAPQKQEGLSMPDISVASFLGQCRAGQTRITCWTANVHRKKSSQKQAWATSTDCQTEGFEVLVPQHLSCQRVEPRRSYPKCKQGMMRKWPSPSSGSDTAPEVSAKMDTSKNGWWKVPL